MVAVVSPRPSDSSRILFLGDIVGRAARNAVIEQLADIRQELDIQFAVVNAENSAGGFGITPQISDQLLAAGCDVLTTGNHVFDKGEISPYFAQQPRLIRPVNMDNAFPGSGHVIIRNDAGVKLAVINVMANLFMAENDNAFAAMDKVLNSLRLKDEADIIVVDIHGEATSEKMAMGHYLDGRVSLVVGTHTHIPTADHHILEGGTAYQTDAGMCGSYDSVIGMNKDAAIGRFTNKKNGSLSVAGGEPSLCGLIVDVDNQTGLARSVTPFRRGGVLSSS